MGRYSAQWSKCRWLQAWFISWGIGGMALGFVLLALAPQPRAAPQVVFAYLGLWLVGTLYWRVRLSRFPCPRCSQNFFGNSRIPHKACPHCGLGQYEDA